MAGKFILISGLAFASISAAALAEAPEQRLITVEGDETKTVYSSHIPSDQTHADPPVFELCNTFEGTTAIEVRLAHRADDRALDRLAFVEPEECAYFSATHIYVKAKNSRASALTIGVTYMPH